MVSIIEEETNILYQRLLSDDRIYQGLFEFFLMYHSDLDSNLDLNSDLPSTDS